VAHISLAAVAAEMWGFNLPFGRSEVGAAPALGAPQIQQNRWPFRLWPTYPFFWDMRESNTLLVAHISLVLGYVGIQSSGCPVLPPSFGGRAGSGPQRRLHAQSTPGLTLSDHHVVHILNTDNWELATDNWSVKLSVTRAVTTLSSLHSPSICHP